MMGIAAKDVEIAYKYYNAQELLTNVGSATFDWDAEARRVRMICGSGTYQFVYDPTAGIPAVLFEDKPSNDVQYVRDPNGSLIARIASDGIRYFHFDQLGSTVAITDGAGTVTDRYDYGAWGEETAILAGTTDNPYRYVGELGYYNHWQDVNLALLQIGVRFYDPAVGQFNQMDPMASGNNRYEYVNNMPTSNPDIGGLFRQPKLEDCQKLLDEMARLWEKMRRHEYGCPNPKHPKELRELWRAWEKAYEKYKKGRCKDRFKLREPQWIPEPGDANEPKKCRKCEPAMPEGPIPIIPIPAPGIPFPAPIPIGPVPIPCPI